MSVYSNMNTTTHTIFLLAYPDVDIHSYHASVVYAKTTYGVVKRLWLNNLRQHVTFSCHVVKGFTCYFITVFLVDDKHPVTKPPPSPPPTVKSVKSKHICNYSVNLVKLIIFVV